ncbi:Uncharacterised protein [Gallibacterium anatis]|uniref:Uncharacterized protein n=1 Tax=Gallibacterium anatis TaxID=750 RepID=A0A377H519_9PAST|nr:hypothetical protein [Gallibacterium anatis]STO37602.1 Uncharacterised protein [Gallibacterium anatis]
MNKEMSSLSYQEKLKIYEEAKKRLQKLPLTPKQYEQRIKFIIEELSI